MFVSLFKTFVERRGSEIKSNYYFVFKLTNAEYLLYNFAVKT